MLFAERGSSIRSTGVGVAIGVPIGIALTVPWRDVVAKARVSVSWSMPLRFRLQAELPAKKTRPSRPKSQFHPKFKDGSVYRQLRPTRLDKIKNLQD